MINMFKNREKMDKRDREFYQRIGIYKKSNGYSKMGKYNI